MAYRLLSLLLLLGACSPTKHTTIESPISQDTSYANRSALAKQWLARIGMMDQFKLFFEQGIGAQLNSLEAITEEAENAKIKITPILSEEFDRLLPEAFEMLAAPLALAFTTEELIECVNSTEKLPSSGPIREKFEAKEVGLRSAFVFAGTQIGERVWAHAMKRLTPAESKALQLGLSKTRAN